MQVAHGVAFTGRLDTYMIGSGLVAVAATTAGAAALPGHRRIFRPFLVVLLAHQLAQRLVREVAPQATAWRAALRVS